MQAGLRTENRPRAATVLALALTALVVALAAPPSPAAAGQGGAFARALSRVDNALRLAIERQPEGLAKSLAASERVCELGQGAEEVGDRVAAEDDWGTLAQLVEQRDEPGLVGVERAFGRAGETLGEVESRFSRRWRGHPARVRELHQGARAVRRGLHQLSAGFGRLRGAFSAWREHRCEGALSSIDSFSAAIPEAMMAINLGMWRLLVLSAPGAGKG